MSRHPKQHTKSERGARNIARHFGKRASSFALEPLEQRALLTASPTDFFASSWHNAVHATDVNADGHVNPLDALLIINDLNAHGVHADGAAGTAATSTTNGSTSNGSTTTHAYLDVNGDKLVSPLDALKIINALNNPPSVQVKLVATDLQGNPITSISSGLDYKLQAYVQDVRPTATPQNGGVFSAYINADYDPTLATVPSDAVNPVVTFGPNFPSAHLENTTNPGSIRDTGGVSGLTPTGIMPELLWTVPVHATGQGTEIFNPSISSNPALNVLVYGNDLPLTADQIDFVGTSVDVLGSTLSVNNISVTEVPSGTTNAVFTVTLASPQAQQVTVQYATADDTAVSPADYIAKSGTLTFAPGVTTQNVTVTVNAKSTPQPATDFFLNLSNPVGGSISDAQGVATIIPPALSIDDQAHAEGNSGLNFGFVFTVTLSAALNAPVTVGYATADQTAVAGKDYVAQSGQLTFNPGQTTAKITVPVIGNTTFEPDKTFLVDLSSPTGGVSIARAAGIGTIQNDDANGVGINDITVLQPADPAASTNAVFTVSLPTASNQTVTVAYATMDGSATVADGDYDTTSGTLTFNPGVTSQTVTVNVHGDATAEADETFTVKLSNAVGLVIAKDTGTATIHNLVGQQNDLVEVKLVVTDLNGNPVTTLNPGDLFQVEAFVDDLRDPAAAQGILSAYLDVTYASGLAMVTGSPVPGSPTTASTTVYGPHYQNIKSGDTTQPGKFIDIGAFDDLAPLGPAEQLLFTVPMKATGSGQLQFTGSPDQENPLHQVLIYGQDTPVPPSQVKYDTSQVVQVGSNSFSVDSVSHNEGNSGTTNFVFTVTRFLPENTTATVVYSTANGTATTADNDYLPTSGTLTFAPGVTSQQLTVQVVGDTKNEADETFFVNLTNPVNASVGVSQGVGTIVNDDAAPTATIVGSSAGEGSPVTFTVNLSTASGQPVTIHYQTVDGTAVAGTNYTATSGTLTFNPGVTTQTISVPTTFTLNQTADLQFQMQLSSPVHVTLANSSATGTILFVKPSGITGFAYVDANGNGKKDPGEVGIANVTITVTQPGTSFSQTTLTGSDGSYSFIGLPPGTYSIVETQPGFFVHESPLNDRYDNVQVVSGQPAGEFDFAEAGLKAQFVQAFFNRRAFLASSEVTGRFGLPSGTSHMDLSQGDIWVSFDGGWQNARKFEALFAASQGTATMTLYDNNFNVLGTSTPETGGAVLIGHATPGSAYFLKISGTNPDVTLKITESVSASNVTAVKPTSGTSNVVFTVFLSAPVSTPVTVAYATADGTARSGVDYTAATGTLTFAAGTVSQPVTVSVTGNTLYAPSETFSLTLSNPSSNVFVDQQGTATLTSTNPPPSMSIADTSVVDPTSGTANAVFKVTLSTPSGLPTLVKYTTALGSAPQADFVAKTGTLTIAAGAVSQNLTVAVNPHAGLASNETFLVKLSNPVGALLVKNQAVGTIQPPASTTGALAFTSTAAITPSISPVLFATGPTTATTTASTTSTANATIGSSQLFGNSLTRSKATDQALSADTLWLDSSLS